MVRNNNIISLENFQKKRKKADFELKAEISIYICRNIETYKIDWSSPDSLLSVEKIYHILKSIFEDLIKKVQTIPIKKKDNYELTFTLLYYENKNADIRYICIPQNITNEKLTEYLFTIISIYELKLSDEL